MNQLLKLYQNQMNQYNQAMANSMTNYGGSSNAFSFPTVDPTGGAAFSGGDPTGGLFTAGGGMVMPVDPFSMMNAASMGGVDPTQMGNNCSVM